jgi:hypothetical protein
MLKFDLGSEKVKGYFMRERERSGKVMKDTTFRVRKKERIYIFGLEGSQAVAARPSGRGSAFNRD